MPHRKGRHLQTAVITTVVADGRISETFVNVEDGVEYVTTILRGPRPEDPTAGTDVKITWDK